MVVSVADDVTVVMGDEGEADNDSDGLVSALLEAAA